MKIIAAQINPIIGNLEYNKAKILEAIEKGKGQGAELIIFPEMAICGYPPEDLLILKSFVEAVEKELLSLSQAAKDLIVIVGGIRKNPEKGEKPLFNTAAIFSKGELIGFQDKTLLPTYDVFSEKRYFEPATKSLVWPLLGKKVGITICEDIWQHAEAVEYSYYSQDPILKLQKENVDFLINISASPFYLGRQNVRQKVMIKASKTLHCPVLFCNQVGGNDGLLFDGGSFYTNEKAEIVKTAASFKEELFFIDTDKPYPQVTYTPTLIADLYDALVLGMRDYFNKQGFKKACLGLSGGIDSAVVACIAKEALGEENVLAIMMPSRFTHETSLNDARKLIETLQIPYKELSIETAFESFLELLEPQFEGKPFDVTEENLQARIRGVILMAFSNKFGYIVLGTSNKSEIAVGYATLYGDMCGGLAILGDVSKEYVYALANWINRHEEIIPNNIIQRPPTAELRHGQKDTDSLPEYSIIDKVLTGYVEEYLSPEEISKKHTIPLNLVKELVRKIHLNEYKRRQAPPSLRVTKQSFTLGRRFPIVQHWHVH